MCFEGITYDGFFVIVIDKTHGERVARFISDAKTAAFLRQSESFGHVREAAFEYRFYRMYPTGFQLVNKFRCHYGGIDFLL